MSADRYFMYALLEVLHMKRTAMGMQYSGFGYSPAYFGGGLISVGCWEVEIWPFWGFCEVEFWLIIADRWLEKWNNSFTLGV